MIVNYTLFDISYLYLVMPDWVFVHCTSYCHFFDAKVIFSGYNRFGTPHQNPFTHQVVDCYHVIEVVVQLARAFVTQASFTDGLDYSANLQ